MVFKYSQQDKGELTLTEYDGKCICIIILTVVKVEKELTWISKKSEVSEWDIGLPTQLNELQR